MEETKHCKWYNDDDIIKGLVCLAGDRACNLCKYDDLAMQDGERTCVNIVAEEAIKLIKHLKDEKEEIRLFNLSLQKGEVDMTIESEMAKSFYNSIVQVFEQNGAKNFFTTTIDIDGKKGRYAFTIEKFGGKTVAEKLAEQKAEIERLKIREDKERLYKDEFQDKCVALKLENAELQKQIDELKATIYRLLGVHDEIASYAQSLEEKNEQAVKDTAKEIFENATEGFVFNFVAESEDYKNGYDRAIDDYDDKLKDFIKERYGVEVE